MSCQSSTSRHVPCRVIPMGSTRYFCGSTAASTPAAVTQLTECSGVLPPKSTATRGRVSAGVIPSDYFASKVVSIQARPMDLKNRLKPTKAGEAESSRPSGSESACTMKK